MGAKTFVPKNRARRADLEGSRACIVVHLVLDHEQAARNMANRDIPALQAVEGHGAFFKDVVEDFSLQGREKKTVSASIPGNRFASQKRSSPLGVVTTAPKALTPEAVGKPLRSDFTQAVFERLQVEPLDAAQAEFKAVTPQLAGSKLVGMPLCIENPERRARRARRPPRETMPGPRTIDGSLRSDPFGPRIPTSLGRHDAARARSRATSSVVRRRFSIRTKVWPPSPLGR